MSAPLSLRLLGFGRFGESLAELALESGVPVRAFDPEQQVPDAVRASGLDELLSEGGIVLCAIPMGRFESVLESIRPKLRSDHLIVDVSSVKRSAREAMSRVCGENIPWVCTHPLFGPMSIAMGERPLRVVLCTDTPHEEGLALVAEFYRRLGCTLFEQSSDEHDQAMANTHAMAFFVAKAMLDLGLGDQDIVPPSFRAMAATIESVRSDAGHLFFPIQHENPFAPAARERLLDALNRIHRQLADVQEQPGAQDSARELAIPPPSTPKELGEARASIDALDTELLELLKRRSQIALRAARAKSAEGRAVHDPSREAKLLQVRRDMAETYALDPDSVTDVFEAILRFSRAEQHRWMQGRGD